jgi:hypothetical protein
MCMWNKVNSEVLRKIWKSSVTIDGDLIEIWKTCLQNTNQAHFLYFMNGISDIANKKRKSCPTEHNQTRMRAYISPLCFFKLPPSWVHLECDAIKTLWQTSVPLAPGIQKCKIEYCDNRERSVFIATMMLAGRPRNLGSVAVGAV